MQLYYIYNTVKRLEKGTVHMQVKVTCGSFTIN